MRNLTPARTPPCALTIFAATIATLFAVITPVPVSAAPIVIPAYRIAQPPTIDGIIHEDSEWKAVPSVSGLVDENTGGAAPDSATFWIAYDDKYVYLAARLADSQPSQIRATQYQTNVNLQGDDYLQLDLDLSGSASDFNVFQVNPKAAINTQLAGGRGAKREWAGEFQAAARITPTGWEVEMRIPWRVMKLPAAGPRDVRINFERFVARTNRAFALAYVQNGAAINTPIWRGVPIPKAPKDRTLQLLPYAYAGYQHPGGTISNVGMDFKTPITDQSQFVGSINPDFRDIENQILSLDYSRFARLPGEYRPFFLEGSQYLGSALFASQEIGQFDVGANAYGKLNDKQSFGVLDADQFGGQNDLVANTTYAPNPTSSYRLGITDLDQAGLHNEAYLARYQGNAGPWDVFVRDMGTYDSQVQHGDNSNVEGFYNAGGLSGLVEYTRVSPNFLPRLGFYPEVDYRGVDGYLNYDKPWDRGVWNDAGAQVALTDYDHAYGGSYRTDDDYQAFGTLRNGLFLTAEQDIPDFEGSHDRLLTLTGGYPKNNPYDQGTIVYAEGREAGIAYESLTLSVNRRPTKRLELTGRYQVVDYAGTTDQAILDANYDLGHDQAAYGRLVKQGADVNAYAAFRRSGNLGTEYYLIAGNPNALTFEPSIILKVVAPIEIRR